MRGSRIYLHSQVWVHTVRDQRRPIHEYRKRDAFYRGPTKELNEPKDEHMPSILDLRVKDLGELEGLKNKKLTVSLTARAKKRVLELASSEENKAYGARPIKQIVERRDVARAA